MMSNATRAPAESAGVPPEVSILVVNWNAGALLSRCVASVRSALALVGAPAYELIVVDNGSTDGSVEAAGLEPSDRLVANSRNLGFGAACNQGAAWARGEFILLLNPDCELRPGSLERCLLEMRQPQVGVCGIALQDGSGALSRSCHRFPGFASLLASASGLNGLMHTRLDSRMLEWDHASDRTVDHVIGAFYLIRRALFEELGGFDERFFVYLEDLDLSLRVQRRGLQVRYLAAPPSFHVGGGVSSQIKATRLFYATRSRLIYGFKHLPRWQAWTHLVTTLLLEPFARSVQALVQRSPRGLVDSWRGFAKVYADLPATLRASR